MNSASPSAAKAQLIRDFLRLTGIQRKIDDGGFFDKFCIPGGAVFMALPGDVLYGEAFTVAKAAISAAYEEHRSVWQDEYDSHVNWEFDEGELGEIVAFLSSPAGKHYQEGLWRMGAYIGTNTEHLIDEILQKACAIASAHTAS